MKTYTKLYSVASVSRSGRKRKKFLIGLNTKKKQRKKCMINNLTKEYALERIENKTKNIRAQVSTFSLHRKITIALGFFFSLKNIAFFKCPRHIFCFVYSFVTIVKWPKLHHFFFFIWQHVHFDFGHEYSVLSFEL